MKASLHLVSSSASTRWDRQRGEPEEPSAPVALGAGQNTGQAADSRQASGTQMAATFM
jgi:hypothetical protein